jgi:phytoene dehydrogenase-like protein
MRYDALVIGAGMSGLAAGIRLATAGKRVAILERHSLWGGLNSFFKRGGRRYDTGLHALTNYVPRGTPGAPLTKVLRQLRIPYEALRLAPQSRSETVFRVGGELVRLEFGNGLDLLRASVARRFPGEVGGFDRLVAALPDYGDAPREGETARGKVREHVRDPLLAEMLLVAPFFYGCASEHDLPWSDFAVLFRSIHLEGMAYPRGGIKTVLDLLVERFRAEGGELRMRSGVARIECGGGAARGVVLDDGTELEAEQIYSSAGLVETRTLCGAPASRADEGDVGRLSFVETCSVLSRPARELGHDATITFFNDGERFRYARPEGLIDVASGVITSTGNYLHDDSGDDLRRDDAAEGPRSPSRTTRARRSSPSARSSTPPRPSRSIRGRTRSRATRSRPGPSSATPATAAARSTAARRSAATGRAASPTST